MACLAPKCNSECGDTIDAALTNQLMPISNVLNIERDRGEPPPVRVTLESGAQYRREADGNMRPYDRRPMVVEGDGEVSFSITTATFAQLRKHLGECLVITDRVLGLRRAEAAARAMNRRHGVRSPADIRIEAFAAARGIAIVEGGVAGAIARLCWGTRPTIRVSALVTDHAERRWSFGHELGHHVLEHPGDEIEACASASAGIVQCGPGTGATSRPRRTCSPPKPSCPTTSSSNASIARRRTSTSHTR